MEPPTEHHDDKGGNETSDTLVVVKKSRRLAGRAARRRRKKIAAIRQQADHSMQILLLQSSVVTDTTTSSSSSSSLSSQIQPVLPIDRSHIWPAVQQLRQMSHEDELIIRGQLGYLPGNAIRVVARASQIHRDWLSSSSSITSNGLNNDNDDPIVLQLYPIVLREEHLGGKASGRRFKSRKRIRRSNNSATTSITNNNNNNDNDDNKSDDMNNEHLMEPFPTIYWLTHPLLHSLISKLEVEGYGIQYEQRIAESPTFMEQMQRANAGYGQERWDMLTESDRTMIRSKQWESAFATSRGVAGIRNPLAVKCLHAHAAHFLSGSEASNKASSDNVVGKWVMEEIQRRYQQSMFQSLDETTGTQKM